MQAQFDLSTDDVWAIIAALDEASEELYYKQFELGTADYTEDELEDMGERREHYNELHDRLVAAARGRERA